MPKGLQLHLGIHAAAIVVGLVTVSSVRAAEQSDGVQFFEQQVKPILQTHCLKCHGGEAKIKGELRLTSHESILKGGDRGAIVLLEQPDQSLVLEAIQYRGDLRMPPKGKLSPEEIQTLSKWVQSGVPWTAGLDLTPPEIARNAQAAPPARRGPPTPQEARDFWSFRPVTRPAVPRVKDQNWQHNPIDAFVLSKLESKGLSPAPPADKVTLLRRASYDLTGLPPTPTEVDAFLADQSPDAYEKVIDRLLASPRYGEKWGRHWLDLVRYAESNSYERDNPKPNVWRYRDYVIRSFNDDKPYDQFVREQLAGDEMPDAGTHPDRLTATGFYRLVIWDDDAVDKEQARYEELDDIVTTTGQVFLGLTVDCARCHDHKIDPILQTDYYRLLAFFQNIHPYRGGGPTDERPRPLWGKDAEAAETRRAEREARRRQVESDVVQIRQNFRQIYGSQESLLREQEVPRAILAHGERVLGKDEFARYKALSKELSALSKPDPGTDMVLCVTERGAKAPQTFVLARGNAAARGKQVQPGFPIVLGTSDPAIPRAPDSAATCGRRTVLADWIASKENPLTARVMANRIWQYHFGRGIVRSSNNFGIQGDKPTHPELLDWLASEFVAQNWHLKPLHRLIMTSNAYRMSCRVDEKALAADPQNDLLWRFDLRRLTAEELRDSILAIDGTLNDKMFGPSTYPKIPKEVLAGQSRPGNDWNTSNAEESARRSVYIHVKRSLHVPILDAFDAAETDRSCPVRFVTVQPTQALALLNGAFLNEEAGKFAQRIRREGGDDARKQTALALRLATCREPAADQIDRAIRLIDGLSHEDGASPDQAMKYLCLMVLNLNEFVYVD